MTPIKNPCVVLLEKPKEFPVPGKTTRYDESRTIDLDSVPLKGGILVKVLVFSIDPWIRLRLESIHDVGDPISNWGVGLVLRSEQDGFKQGDSVVGIFNMEHYTVVTDFEHVKVIKNEEALPWSVYLGPAGMPGKSAFYGWKEYAHAKEGETVFVTAGAGAVGSVVIQLAKHDGLKVISSAGSEEKVAWIKSLGADVVFNYKTTDTREILRKEGPIDLFWDNVGGATLDEALLAAAKFARFIECGMISGYNIPHVPLKNLNEIFKKSITIQGFFILDLEAKHGANFDRVFPKLIKEGKIKYREDVTRGLENAEKAILAQQKGENKGKSIVVVQHE